MPKCAKIIFCNCGYYDIIDRGIRNQIFSVLTERKLEFEAVQDLCELAARKDPRLKSWAESEHIKIVACHSRAVKWLFAAAEAPLDSEKVEFLNMKTSTAKEIIDALQADTLPADAERNLKLEDKGQWVPWFPVIDYNRCKNCLQCLSFCLFSVYGLSGEAKVQVRKPENCKTNCPACARVCPHKAIIFPKYTESPINGSEVDDTQVDSEKTKDDIYEILKKRGIAGKRFEKDKADLQKTFLVKLKDQMGVPPEVLESLSATEIIKLEKMSKREPRE